MGELFVIRTSISSDGKWKVMTNPTMEKFKSWTSDRLVTRAKMLEFIGNLNCGMVSLENNRDLYHCTKDFLLDFQLVFGIHWRIGFLSTNLLPHYDDSSLTVEFVLWRADPVMMPRSLLLIQFDAEYLWEEGFARIFQIEAEALVPLENPERTFGGYPLAHYIVPLLAHYNM